MPSEFTLLSILWEDIKHVSNEGVPNYLAGWKDTGPELKSFIKLNGKILKASTDFLPRAVIC